MEQRSIAELLQSAEQLTDEWEVLDPLLFELSLKDQQNWQTKKKAKELLDKLEQLRDDLWKTSLDLIDYLDDDNDYLNKIYDNLDVVYDEVDKGIHQLKEIFVVDELLGDIRHSNMLGQQSVYGNNLSDYKIRKAIATSNPTDPVFQMIGMSLWIFVSYIFGAIMSGVFEDVLPYSIFGSYALSSSVASMGGIICGVLCFIVPLIFVRKSNIKKAEFAKHAYAQSKMFQAKLIKVVQETPTSFYVHFEDEDGKKRISPISEETRRALCKNGRAKYVLVVKYPKYEGGYGYMALDPTDFTNDSSAKFVD